MEVLAYLMTKSIFIVISLFSIVVTAAPAKIITETALYESNDFDADIITYLPANKNIQASKRIYKGKSFGSFRKVKIKKSTYGFVSDVDIKLLTELKRRKKKLKKTLTRFKKEQLESRYVYINNYIGLGFSFSRFTEKNIVDEQNRNSPLTAINFQLIGPGSLIPKLPLNFNFSYAKLPSYYKDLNTDQTKSLSGYTMFGDISYPIALSDLDNVLIYWSIGASFRLVKATVYKQVVSEKPSHSVKMNQFYWGSLLSVGALWEVSKNLAAKIDARYHYNGGVFFEEMQTTLLFKY